MLNCSKGCSCSFFRYNAMVFEALSALKDANGSDLNAIVSFIEVR